MDHKTILTLIPEVIIISLYNQSINIIIVSQFNLNLKSHLI